MKRWFVRLVPVLLCAFFLASCVQADGFGASLLQPPEVPQQQTQLLQTVTDYLGESITLKYPVSSLQSSPFLWWDADGDGIQELVVLYQNTAKSKNVQLAVLRQEEGSWYAAHVDVEGAAGDVDALRVIRLKEGGEYLLAAYQDSTGIDWTVCLYRWDSGALRECARQVCQQYVAADMDGSGFEQLALVQYSEMYGNLQLHVYGAPLQGDAEQHLAERSATVLDSRFERCRFMQIDSGREKEITLVMDFTDGFGNSLGEVMSYRSGRFIRCYTEDDSNIPNFTARPFEGLLPADQDGDGMLEVPRVETQVFGSGTPVRFFLVSWYRITADEMVLRDYSLVDMQEHYVLRLPESWRGQIMLQADGGGVWSLRMIENSIRRAWFCIAEEKPHADSLLVGEVENGQFWLQFPDETLMEERVILLNGLRPLYD